ncbi:MAG TPA: hypothetical protein VK388_14075 [Pyrinomonadaceae bacterium]|nr:hypothetical protein [Pyrinomonadaceae bacterium]
MDSSFKESAEMLKALSADVEYCYDKIEEEEVNFGEELTFVPYLLLLKASFFG